MTSGLERRGSDLLRPVGSWTPAVHEYLKHLESVGFHGAPRVVSIEGDHEVLTFLEGDVLADPEWEPGRGNPLPAYARTDDALAAVGHLLRDLHEASGSFQPQRTGYRFHPHHRLRVFVDAYGLTDRPTIIPALQQAKLKIVEQVQHWPIDAAGAAGSLEFLAGELRWLDSITPALRRAL